MDNRTIEELLSGDKPLFYVGRNVPVFVSPLCEKDKLHLYQNKKISGTRYRRLIVTSCTSFTVSKFKRLSDFSTML